MKKNIILYTAGRSDFGILQPLILNSIANKNINLKVIFGYAHYEKIFGRTYKESNKLNIKKFKIKLKKKNLGNNIHNTILSFSETANQISNILKKNNCDNFIVAGDRYETLAAAIVAKNYNIKISHLCGGSITLGSLDDHYRNCISNIADYHFVETGNHKVNLNRKGIFKNIYVVGAPALENLSQYIKKKKQFNSKDKRKAIKAIVTFHPDTTQIIFKNINDLKILLKFISKLKNFKIVFTYPNADTGFINYIKLIKKFKKENSSIKLIKHLGIKKYYEHLNTSHILIGNSSSGIIESASFKIPVLNVGNRQKRFSVNNVINCKSSEIDLRKIKTALSEKFNKSIVKIKILILR